MSECPTCGSDDPETRGLVDGDPSPDSEWLEPCSDPWHSSEAPDEGRESVVLRRYRLKGHDWTEWQSLPLLWAPGTRPGCEEEAATFYRSPDPESRGQGSSYLAGGGMLPDGSLPKPVPPGSTPPDDRARLEAEKRG